MNTANSPTPVYATMQMRMRTSFLTLPASLPKTIAAGKAMTCVSKSARSRFVVSKPSAVPKEVAISMMVYTPSIYRKNAIKKRMMPFLLGTSDFLEKTENSRLKLSRTACLVRGTKCVWR